MSHEDESTAVATEDGVTAGGGATAGSAEGDSGAAAGGEGHGAAGGVDPAHDWDERYAGSGQVWSGNPNGTLVAEVAGLAPGRVLDVGCGEGADALWLAERGWTVTALDVSRVALDRARVEAAARGVEVQWLLSGLVEAALPAQGFDLVSAQYPALFRTPGHLAEHALLDAVAPGGVLLVVHHPTPTTEEAAAHGFHPDDYVSPANVAALLGDEWMIEVDEVRERNISGGAGSHHSHDVVLRARRARSVG